MGGGREGIALARISELGVQKYTFGMNWVSPFLFHPIPLYTKNMDIGVSQISNRVSPLAKGGGGGGGAGALSQVGGIVVTSQKKERNPF